MCDRMPPQYRPLARRAHWARRTLGLAIAVGVVSLVADIQQWKLVQRIAAGDATLDQVDVNESVQTAVAVAQLAAVVLAAVFFLTWFHRAYANLRPLGADGLPHGPGWAVGYWFVPVLNLVRPATVAARIWNASDPRPPDDAPRRGSSPGLVVGWWLTFVLSGLLTRVGNQMWASAHTSVDLRDAAAALVAADVVGIVAGCLAVLFVERTTDRQARRASTSDAVPVPA
jgi:heme/copper-type cytochrome/quinol oxidase subunit 2